MRYRNDAFRNRSLIANKAQSAATLLRELIDLKAKVDALVAHPSIGGIGLTEVEAAHFRSSLINSSAKLAEHVKLVKRLDGEFRALARS
jgi:hypothetical protein